MGELAHLRARAARGRSDAKDILDALPVVLAIQPAAEFQPVMYFTRVYH